MALLGTQGQKSQIGYAFEAVAHGVRGAIWRFLRVMEFECNPDRPLDPSKNMDPSGRTQRGRNEIITLPVKFKSQPTIDDLAPLSAALRGYASIARPTFASAPVDALSGTGAGNVENGIHYYKVTFVSPAGETSGGAASDGVTVVDKTTNGKVALSSIAVGPAGTTARKVYRTVAADPVTGQYKLLTTIADNTTVIYTDNTADASLGANIPTTTQPAVWTVRDLQTGDSVGTLIDTLSFEFDKDISKAQLNLETVLTERQIDFEQNAPVVVSWVGESASYTRQGDAVVEVTAATYTGKLYTRGILRPEQELWFKCTDAGALDGAGAKVVIKSTEGATYGTTEYFVTADEWADAIIEDGVTHASGDPLEPFQFMFTAGGTLSVNDEFSIPAARTKYAATYSSRQRLSCNGLTITADGEARTIKKATLKTTAKKEADRGCGRKTPYGFLKPDIEMHELSFDRRFVDQDFVNLLETAEEIIVDMDLLGDPIGRGDYRERARFYLAQVQVSGAGSDPKKSGAMDEPIKLWVSGTEAVAACVETYHCTHATVDGQ